MLLVQLFESGKQRIALVSFASIFSIRLCFHCFPILLVEIVHQILVRVLALGGRTEIVGFCHGVAQSGTTAFESWRGLLWVLGHGDMLLTPLNVVEWEGPFVELDTALGLRCPYFEISFSNFFALLHNFCDLGLFLVIANWRSLSCRLMFFSEAAQVDVQEGRDALRGEGLVDLL